MKEICVGGWVAQKDTPKPGREYTFLYKGRAYPFGTESGAEQGAAFIIEDETLHPQWFETWGSSEINWDAFPELRTIG